MREIQHRHAESNFKNQMENQSAAQQELYLRAVTAEATVAALTKPKDERTKEEKGKDRSKHRKRVKRGARATAQATPSAQAQPQLWDVS